MVSAAGSLPGVRPPAHRPWVIAHRGASAAFPENTVEAFRAAAAMGADAIELDVRRSADGRPLVHHDAVVPGVGPIVSFTAAELRRHTPWLPGLEEALEACAGTWVDIEVKNSPADPDWDPADCLVETVVARLPAEAGEGRILLSSFNPPTLARARALAPGLPTGCLVDRPGPAGEAAAGAAQAGHRMLLPHAAALAGDAARAWVGAAHEAGLLLVTWTVDDPGEVRRLAAAGIDGVITNRPDAVLSALGEHHHGHGR
jgi:glycerophosphoryl diester phosphodiesterase